MDGGGGYERHQRERVVAREDEWEQATSRACVHATMRGRRVVYRDSADKAHLARPSAAAQHALYSFCQKLVYEV